LLGELAKAPEEILGVAAERKAEPAPFHVGHPTNVKVVAVLASVVVVCAGCASAAADGSHRRGALTDAELSWIRAYVGWRSNFDHIRLAGGRSRAVRALTGCSRSLVRAVRRDPSRRFRPAARLVRRACADWERYAVLFHRFYERNDFGAGPALAAAETHAGEASDRALRSLSSLLWESRRLPTIDRASSVSRLQPRYRAAANALTSRELQVRCWTSRDWERVLREAAAFEDSTAVDADGFANFFNGHINLAPEVCKSLDDLTYRGKRPHDGEPLDDLAYGAFVLAHETAHIAGVDIESLATCDGVQHTAAVAQRLGAGRSYARRLAVAYWQRVYPQEPDEYRTVRCGPNRPLDRSPGDGVWP
jgi:hypothetical protein